MKNLKTFLAWIIFSEAVGFISGFLTRDSVVIYSTQIVKPFLAPPPLIFPIVWTILYALMGYGVARIYIAPISKERTQGIRIFLAQLFFNFCWSFIFFSYQAFGAAFIWLIALIILVAMMIKTFSKINFIAAVIQIPYLLWLIFAGYLNFSVWFLN